MDNFFKRLFSRQKNNGGSKISFRLNFIFVIVGILFAALIAKLAYLQVIDGNQYKAEVNRSDTTIKTDNVQRGMIYDSTGKLLVGNSTHRAITYTKGINVLPAKMYEIANELSQYITVPTDTLTKRQMANYYIASPTNAENIKKKLNGNYTSDNLTEKEVDYVLKNVDLNNGMKNPATIYTKMNGAYQLSTTYIKTTNVSNREVAQVGEHLSEMPGIQIGTSWSREYPQGNAIQSIIGTVSSEKIGLPSDRLNELLAQGYSRNDSVGQSYLEQLYEPTLKGTKAQTQVEVTRGTSVAKEIKKYGGQKGDNLQLTINDKFQNKLQSLVRDSVSGSVGDSTGAYAVVMNPHTGAIIGMAGVNRNPKTGKVTSNELGAINNSIVMGSVVKGATVSGALMDGVITPTNNVLTEKPIITGGTKKTSWFNKNGEANMNIDASTALEVSSNSYMMQLAMKEGKFKYVEGGPLTMNPDVFNIMRGYFNQFGLGVKTGVDIPGESAGIQGLGGYANIGHALDLSFGNYDAYTTLQVAQYISTIANGGYRLQPHIVQSIRGTTANGKLGRVKYSFEPNVLNEINMTQAQKKVVTDGFYDVVHGTNQYKTGINLNTIKPSVSAKTGTAQTYYGGKHGTETVTLSLGSYAPSSDPQVVVALAIPNLPTDAEDNNTNLAKEIYAAYWKYVQSTSTLSNSN
ncbi:penicillin-binding protein 2 [Lactobacillus sp. Sy-1]|uniref:peptidoglycan D,D-transpeptidase FtsI family protein n=1 Tax=Lactobacillus sp. Sy-1 TaxID=2109645 RepID=UPI001C56687B|nr:penicillin-binding protein 2 [Lactobacillus sp. Sy-1]MBW1605671.1 penicillin-binding protein 2 [Lactobacillus sp. Sy-1]